MSTQAEGWAPPFKVGEVMVSHFDFSEDAIRQFATNVHDFNPLHHDAAMAARSRFGGLIASGAHTIGMMLGALAGHVTPRCGSLGLGCDFRLLRGVPAGTHASAEWTVSEIRPKPSLGGHTLSLEGVLKQEDHVFITGSVLIVVMPTEALVPGRDEPGL